MNSYHGTSRAIAETIESGNVDVTLGGGELGQGFYSGEHLHEAKAWAFQRYGDKTQNVVRFETQDAEIESLNFEVLDPGTAGLKRYHIKLMGQTRTFCFGVDMVWAPIVGSERASGDQYKWESIDSQDLLNGTKTQKTIV